MKGMREGTGMTQKDFANYFNIPVRTIQDWEQERRTPPEYVLQLIEYKIKKEKLSMKKEQVRNFVEKEIWENLMWEGMEAVLYKDGYSWARQEGSTGTDEDEIIYSVSLSSSYWSESYALDFNQETEEYEKDETMKEDFIDDIADEILEEIEKRS